jgi:hypothetical protein
MGNDLLLATAMVAAHGSFSYSGKIDVRRCRDDDPDELTSYCSTTTRCRDSGGRRHG